MAAEAATPSGTSVTPTPTAINLTPTDRQPRFGRHPVVFGHPHSAIDHPGRLHFEQPQRFELRAIGRWLACAGKWDTFGRICAPQGAGVTQVTATANGVTSTPVTVYVHEHVDLIKVTLINPPIPQPDCITPGSGTRNPKLS